MNPLEDPYQPPASDEPYADTARLSKEEWRYAGKAFFIAMLGGALLRGAWHTFEANYVLRSFHMRLAGVMVVCSFLELGSVVAAFAVLVALTCVIRRRTKAGMAAPKRGLFWPMFLVVPLSTPIAALMVSGFSLLILLMMYDEGFQFAWRSARSLVVPSDASMGMVYGAASSIIYAALGADLARWMARMRQWAILACIVAWFVTGLTARLAGAILRPIVHAAE